jgi:hypothetical protein
MTWGVSQGEKKKIRFFVNLDPNKFSLLCRGERQIAMINRSDHGYFYLLKGLLEGVRNRWYENGQLEEQVNYRSGLLEGVAKRWHPNGALEATWLHQRGVRHGTHCEWHENGKLRVEAVYFNGLITGIFKRYDTDGKIQRKEVYVRGVIIRGHVKKLLESDTLTAEQILKIKNTALRRVCLEQLGYGRFLNQVKHEIISRDGEYELIRINWHKREEPIYLVKVKCSTTGVFYTLRVPPTMKTVKEAIAWTFGIKANEYAPQVEA